MSRNGSGTYVLPAGNPVVTGTVITSTWANTTMSDIATALTGSIAADGQTVVTGNIQMGNNRITGLADGISPTDASTVGQTTNANITSGNINGAVIGNLNPANGTFTNLVATVSATVPTVASTDDSTKAASTAYVKAVIGGGSNVVNSFNTRKGAVTLLDSDVNGALGYTACSTTGSNATGTFPIGVTGNAGTVTNGVYVVGDQTIDGVKTFAQTIVGNLSGNATTSSNTTGNAATVTNGVYTEGDQTINGSKTFSATIIGNLSGNAGTSSTCTGNAATATLAANATNAYACSGNSATATNATNATNSTNALNVVTANFSIVEEGGKIMFKYQGTNVASIDASGNFTSLANVTAFAPSV